MAAVRVVERAVHVVIDVVAVRHGAVAGLRVRAGAGALDGRARAGAPPVHLEAVLVGVALVRCMEVAVVEVVRVVAVPDGLVAASIAVAMRVLPVLLAAHGGILASGGSRVTRGIIC